MMLEGRLEALLEQEPERHVQARDERDGRGERRERPLLRLACRLPVEVEAREIALLAPPPGGLRDGDERQARRRHQRLLRAPDCDVDTPLVDLERYGPDR